MSIVCSNLTKYYGSKKIISDVSVTIPEGGITGLIGPNGAGKSTLIKLITGLVRPSDGHVHIDGFDSYHQRLAALEHLGAIVEWPSFYPDLTARRNLEILSGGFGKKYQEKLREVTAFMGVSHLLDRKTNTFSTGQKQRFGIALALLPDSKYIILDEPANGLDPAGIVEIRNLIRQCSREAGVTVLVSSHLLSEMEMICDNVIMLVGGTLRAAGPLKKLLGEGNKYRVVTPDLENCCAFLTRKGEEKRFAFTAAPRINDRGIILALEEGSAPEEITDELFRGGFRLSHFGREEVSLEEFFISKSAAVPGGKA